MKLLEEYGIPRLNGSQIEDLSQKAEEAARRHILSRVSLSEIEKLDIAVETVGTKPITVSVDIDLGLNVSSKTYSANELADSAVAEAFEAVEQFLGGLLCQPKR
ncbi:MAG: DUF3194 domain-containing protein [Candidatus Bathyarchaeia archaeon]